MVVSFFPLSKLNSLSFDLGRRGSREDSGLEQGIVFLICSLLFILERPLLCGAWCITDEGRTHGQEIMLSYPGLPGDSRQRRPVFPFESAAQSCLLFSGSDCLT